MKPEKLISEIAQQKIVILGLFLILTGNSFQATFLKVQIDGVLANIGALFLFVGTFQWIFDEKARRELIYELFRSIRGEDRMHRNGLIDCLTDSKKVSESQEWLKAKILVIGIHYSSRFLEDNLDLIKERIENKRKTVICHLAISTIAAKYIEESNSGNTEVKRGINKLKSIIQSEFQNSKYIELIEHRRVLRYTFIYTELGIWIKFFTNTEGRATVPAFKIGESTPLFDFFKDDIQKLGGIN